MTSALCWHHYITITAYSKQHILFGRLSRLHDCSTQNNRTTCLIRCVSWPRDLVFTLLHLRSYKTWICIYIRIYLKLFFLLFVDHKSTAIWSLLPPNFASLKTRYHIHSSWQARSQIMTLILCFPAPRIRNYCPYHGWPICAHGDRKSLS